MKRKDANTTKTWTIELGLDETVEITRDSGAPAQQRFRIVHAMHDAADPEMTTDSVIDYATTLTRAFEIARTYVESLRHHAWLGETMNAG
jgi:hypothetical protein